MATEDGKGAQLREPILRADGEFELQRKKYLQRKFKFAVCTEAIQLVIIFFLRGRVWKRNGDTSEVKVKVRGHSVTPTSTRRRSHHLAKPCTPGPSCSKPD